MSNAKLMDWGIPKEPIQDYCTHSMAKEKYFIQIAEKDQNKNQLIKQLQTSCIVLSEIESDLLEYVQTNRVKKIKLVRLKNLYFDLNKEIKIIASRLKELNSNKNDVLENFYSDIIDDLERKQITHSEKPEMLSNAAEIKKDFLDFIKPKVIVPHVSFRGLFKDGQYEKAIKCLIENMVLEDNGNGTFEFIASKDIIREPQKGICTLYMSLDHLGYLKPNKLNGVQKSLLLSNTFICPMIDKNPLINKKNYSDAKKERFSDSPYLKFYSTILPKIHN